METIIALLVGHILGDYFFQTHRQAQNKTKPGWEGDDAAFIHSVSYTFIVGIVMAFTGVFGTDNVEIAVLVTIVVILLSHFPIDRYGIAWKIMKLKGGPNPLTTNPLEAGFAAIIYVVIDNFMHLAIMYWWFVWALPRMW